MSLSLGRTQWVRPKIKTLFKRLAKLNGFTDETIWILPRQGEHAQGQYRDMQAGTSSAHQYHHFVV